MRSGYGKPRKKNSFLLTITAAAFIIAVSWVIVSCPGSGSSGSGSSEYTGLKVHNPLLYSGAMPPPQLPDVSALSVSAADFKTGRVLYSRNSSLPIPPASMTKLVTLALLFEDIKKGVYNKDTVITVPAEGDFRSLPPRSSLMFLEKGQTLTVLELMKGLAVPSGNDAAVTAALLSAGSGEEFVEAMNRFVKSIGLENTSFADSSGLSSSSITTADDFVKLSLYYIREYPEALEELNSLPEFTYPLKQNLGPPGRSARGPIKQYNNNLLLGRVAGVDGLKTGYIDESGYNIAVTAERGGRRVVAVLMGIEADSSYDGLLTRALEAGTVINYCFDNYHLFRPDPVYSPVKVRWGREKLTGLVSSGNRELLLSTEELASVSIRVFIRKHLNAPVSAGDKAGYGELFLDGEVIASWDAAAAEDIPRQTLAGLLGLDKTRD